MILDLVEDFFMLSGELPGLVELNPCSTGKHHCDPMALCLPGDGIQFHCQCAMGFQGDGRNCYGTDLSVFIFIIQYFDIKPTA